jgi:hypothetical protein
LAVAVQHASWQSVPPSYPMAALLNLMGAVLRIAATFCRATTVTGQERRLLRQLVSRNSCEASSPEPPIRKACLASTYSPKLGQYRMLQSQEEPTEASNWGRLPTFCAASTSCRDASQIRYIRKVVPPESNWTVAAIN